jgi:putative membrane protein
MLPGKEEQQKINDLACEFEAATGAQALAAVVGKADSYPEIPWKAFALGAALAALVVVADELFMPDWASIHAPILDVAAILVSGSLACAAAMVWPALGRTLLNAERAGMEVRQYAEGLFLRREVFRTQARTGVLILIATFERRVSIQLDTGIAQHYTREDIAAVIEAMTPDVRAGRLSQAFGAGFKGLAGRLAAKGVKLQSHGNELADGAIVEEGE